MCQLSLGLGLGATLCRRCSFRCCRLGLPGFARLLCENRPAIFQNCLGGFELVIATGVSIKAFRQAGTFSPIRGADELGGTSMQSTLSGHIAVYSQWLLSKRKNYKRRSLGTLEYFESSTVHEHKSQQETSGHTAAWRIPVLYQFSLLRLNRYIVDKKKRTHRCQGHKFLGGPVALLEVIHLRNSLLQAISQLVRNQLGILLNFGGDGRQRMANGVEAVDVPGSLTNLLLPLLVPLSCSPSGSHRGVVLFLRFCSLLRLPFSNHHGAFILGWNAPNIVVDREGRAAWTICWG